MTPKNNPFNTESLQKIRYIPQRTSFSEILKKIHSLNFRGEIVGPGRNREKHLIERFDSSSAKAWIQYKKIAFDPPSEDITRQVRSTDKDIILLDGCEQMNGLSWLLFKWKTRRAAGLIITTHSKGRLPLIHETVTSPELLEEIVLKLGAPPLLKDKKLSLFAKAKGNIREALSSLYDEYGQLLVIVNLLSLMFSQRLFFSMF